MSSKSWTEREWVNPPLGVALENYLKSVDWEKHPLGVKVRVMRRNSGKLWKWSLCCLLLLHDNLRHSFRSTLSKTQLGSLVNLLEWWTGKYQDVRLSAAAIAYIVLESAVEFPNDAEFRREAAKLSKSSYHYKLFHLFCLEFSIDRKPVVSSIFPSGLTNARESAALHACTQRIGCVCYQAAVREHQQRLGQTGELKAESNVSTFGDSIARALTHIITWGFVELDSPHTLLKIPLYAATVWPYKLSQVMESFTPIPNFGAVSDPCWWLTAQEKDGIPHYLWDVAHERTVETSGLKSPSYTAISHTWGRWRRDDYAQIRGVDWLVPRNTLFRVEDLPRILKNVPREGNYVWFDLVCIPQDMRDSKMKRIAEQEIARQAKIFSTASRAVAWISDIDSINGLKSVARWLALSLVEHPSGGRRSDFNPLDEETHRVQNSATTVFSRVAGEVGDINLEAFPRLSHGWLNSLWTFQEACLRPDMWICSKDWIAVRLVDGDVGSTLELSGLMALLRQIVAARATDPSSIMAGAAMTETMTRLKSPRNLVVLASVMMLSGMSEIFQPNIGDILWQGSNRHCQEKRSEAIMSVVGVTDWDRRAQHEDLVLGKYSLAFIKKVRERWGSSFFHTILLDVKSQMISPDSDFRPIGSMLPFTDRDRSSFMLPERFSTADRLEHDSIAEWEIQVNGSVRIREAAIIASSKSEIGKPMPAGINEPGMAVERDQPHLIDIENKVMVDLSIWLRNKPYECYAVCTGYSHHYNEASGEISWRCEGLVFKKLPHPPKETSHCPGLPLEYFLKFATFDVDHTGMMQKKDLNPSTKVNWIVL